MPETAKRIRSFRAFLETESNHLLERHRFGLGGREIARGRSDAVDVVVGRACRMVADDLDPSTRKELAPCAIVALGAGAVSCRPTRTSTSCSCSVRPVAECVRMGRFDLHARNAMSEARLLVGSEELFSRFVADLRAGVFGHPKVNRFFKEAMAAEVRGRRAKHGRVVAMQEPDLKEGAGGLRDRADDEPGLVYRIATTLTGLRLNITLAKLSTEKNQALDVFYVTDEGEPLGAGRHAEVEAALLNALGGWRGVSPRSEDRPCRLHAPR